jgi:hypothetical protein
VYTEGQTVTSGATYYECEAQGIFGNVISTRVLFYGDNEVSTFYFLNQRENSPYKNYQGFKNLKDHFLVKVQQ